MGQSSGTALAGQSPFNFQRLNAKSEQQIEALADAMMAMIEPMRFYEDGATTPADEYDLGNSLDKADIVTAAMCRVIARVSVDYLGHAYWKEQDGSATEGAVDIFKAMAVHHGKAISAELHLQDNPGSLLDAIRREVTVDQLPLL